jgi:hypothetical protein
LSLCVRLHHSFIVGLTVTRVWISGLDFYFWLISYFALSLRLAMFNACTNGSHSTSTRPCLLTTMRLAGCVLGATLPRPSSTPTTRYFRRHTLSIFKASNRVLRSVHVASVLDHLPLQFFHITAVVLCFSCIMGFAVGF